MRDIHSLNVNLSKTLNIMNFSVNSINLRDEETQYETANDAENDWSALDKYLITSPDIKEESTKQSMISENKDLERDVKAAEKNQTLTVENTMP